MKRKIVQHGPCTLTVSLPAEWVRNFSLQKGDEITIEQRKEGLLLTAGKERHYGQKKISVKGYPHIIAKAVAALYKCGYDEIIVEYGDHTELEKIHQIIATGYIGFEIIDETKDTVIIRKVSEPSQQEFKTIFRRIFHFLHTTAEESLEAARDGDLAMYQKLILRDENINKLSDFCRRVVNERGQREYEQDTALYHILEQLEKIADVYKEINTELLEKKTKLSKKTLGSYAKANMAIAEYEDLFFSFSIEKASKFMHHCNDFLLQEENAGESTIEFMLRNIVRELYNLLGTTMILHL